MTVNPTHRPVDRCLYDADGRIVGWFDDVVLIGSVRGFDVMDEGAAAAVVAANFGRYIGEIEAVAGNELTPDEVADELMETAESMHRTARQAQEAVDALYLRAEMARKAAADALGRIEEEAIGKDA